MKERWKSTEFVKILESDDIDAQLRHLRDTSHRQQQEQKRFISKLESEIRQLHAEVSLCVFVGDISLTQ